MSPSQATLRRIFDRLHDEGLTGEREAGAASDYLESRSFIAPWYIRTMVGFGAWLASLLLIGFIAGFSIAMEGGYAIIGILFITGAVFFRHQSNSDFVVQSSLAVSLAGQALFAWGFTDVTGNEVKGFLAAVASMSLLLFFILPDRIHRVLMVLFFTGSLIGLTYAWDWNALVPLYGPVFAALLVYLYQQRGVLLASRFGKLVQPLVNGLLLSAFGALLLSTIYVLPELGDELNYYPRPWISTIGLGVLFLYMGSLVWPELVSDAGKPAMVLLYALMLAVIAGAWNAPGLLLAMIVVMLGASAGHRTFIGAGIAFLAVFIAAYFYGIEMTMLTKSITLVATGSVVLLARWLILKVVDVPGSDGGRHA
ncbi:MAG: DUF4401 domain-containing protein [Gammaproteobacteria bacterium]|nr:DUF4401 domain-containing protein [Gammaproteobacteria bacterium]